jgi:hypothetical protein
MITSSIPEYYWSNFKYGEIRIDTYQFKSTTECPMGNIL